MGPTFHKPECQMVGAHPKVIEFYKVAGRLKHSYAPVLIQGEPGTGKKLAAEILHHIGFHGKPFVAVSCTTLMPTLLEKEFFGSDSYEPVPENTGAEFGRLGSAGTGTLFLEEVSDVPLWFQARLLDALEKSQFNPLNSSRVVPFRARVVASSSRDLSELAQSGAFRKDLYLYLSSTVLSFPPLRDRKGDIETLTLHFLEQYGRTHFHRNPLLPAEVVKQLKHYHWPGNVEELERVVQCTASRPSPLTPQVLSYCMNGNAAP